MRKGAAKSHPNMFRISQSIAIVNLILSTIHSFVIVFKIIFVTLYNIPYCIFEKL